MKDFVETLATMFVLWCGFMWIVFLPSVGLLYMLGMLQ